MVWRCQIKQKIKDIARKEQTNISQYNSPVYQPAKIFTSPECSLKTSSRCGRYSVKFQRMTEKVPYLPALFITSGYRIVRAAAHNSPPNHPSMHFSSLAGRRDLLRSPLHASITTGCLTVQKKKVFISTL